MERIEKTVFISYRRTNAPWALAIFQYLTQHGYDVFYDFKGLASGDFERVILENIDARAHFVVLLTPSALERCGEPGDYFRAEIEAALRSQRNIVPLMLEGFDYRSPDIARHLTGKLATLQRYNALRVPADYFDEAMDRLREKHLNVPLDAVLHPPSAAARETAKTQQTLARHAPRVQDAALSAQEWYERGVITVDLDEKVRCYSEALRVYPDDVASYNNRGVALKELGDFDGAMADYSEAIRLDPDFSYPYKNRGLVRHLTGDLDGSLADYSKAIRLDPIDADAHRHRAAARYAKGDVDGALRDYGEAIRLNPTNAVAYCWRGLLRREIGDFDGALNDCEEAVRLDPRDAAAYCYRGAARHSKGDIDGALKDFAEAIRLHPEFSGAYRMRAHVRKTSGDPNGAAQDEQAARLIEQKLKK